MDSTLRNDEATTLVQKADEQSATDLTISQLKESRGWDCPKKTNSAPRWRIDQPSQTTLASRLSAAALTHSHRTVHLQPQPIRHLLSYMSVIHPHFCVQTKHCMLTYVWPHLRTMQPCRTAALTRHWLPRLCGATARKQGLACVLQCYFSSCSMACSED